MNQIDRQPLFGCGSTAIGKTSTSRLVKSFLFSSTAFLLAGDPVQLAPIPATPTANSESQGACDFYRNIGKIYSNSDNPWIQSFSIVNRFHYNYAYIDGTDFNGDDFTYETDEVRRFRPGIKMKFLNNFELNSSAEVYRDNGPIGGESKFNFKHLWDGYLNFNVGKAFNLGGFDSFKIGYGKREVGMGAEWYTSSNTMKVIERAALSNKIWASDTEFSNPTGGWIEISQGNLDTRLGIYTSTQDDFIAGWSDGQLYHLSMKYDYAESSGAKKAHLLWTTFYQDADLTDERLAGGVEWATSLSTTYGRGPWEMTLEGIYGNNGDQSNASREGDFWGVIFIPSYWLIDKRLELVGRYHYQGSENSQGARLNGRYSRRAETAGDADLNGGRGDQHHSYYLGLNYHICGDNLKVMAGVQYDDMNRGNTDVYDGWTTLLGFRTYF